jgi:hypothetical protein
MGALQIRRAFLSVLRLFQLNIGQRGPIQVLRDRNPVDFL